MRVGLKVPGQDDRLRQGVHSGAGGDEDDAHYPVGDETTLWGFVLDVVLPFPLAQSVALLPNVGPREDIRLADGLFDFFRTWLSQK